MSTVAQQLRSRARDAGVQAWVCASRLGGPPAHVGLDPDDAVPMASLYKLPLAYFWADQVELGLIDFHDRIALRRTGRAPGPTGISALQDDVDISHRDLVRLMISLSDNAAAEELLTRLGLGPLAAWLDQTQVQSTSVRRGTVESWQIVAQQTGGGPAAMAPGRLADVDSDVETSEYDAALASATSAADMCRLLAGLWESSGAAHEVVRDAMRHQAWRHRIGSGFPHDDVLIAGKTGTLGRLRHEVAVVEYPHEVPIAVAVLTSSARAEIHQPAVDLAIGELARLAVRGLRLPR